jgi:hypothetical protein
MDYGINAVIYGPNMVGKTWLACTAPGPRLFLDVEGKTRFLRTRRVDWNPSSAPPAADGTWDTCVVPVRSYKAAGLAMEWLTSGKHPFRSVVLDSASDMQQRLIHGLFGVAPLQKQDWGTVLRETQKLFSDMRDLTMHPTNPLDAVILTARVMHVGDDGRQIPFMQGKMAEVLPHMMDLCAYLSVAAVEGKETRRLLTASHPSFATGQSLGGALAPVINDPDISVMLEMVRAAVTRDTQGE